MSSIRLFHVVSCNLLIYIFTVAIIFALIVWRQSIPDVKYITMDKVADYCEAHKYCNNPPYSNHSTSIIYNDFDCMKCFGDCGFENSKEPDYLTNRNMMDCVRLIIDPSSKSYNSKSSTIIYFNECYNVNTIKWNELESLYPYDPTYTIWMSVTVAIICIFVVIYLVLCFVNYDYVNGSCPCCCSSSSCFKGKDEEKRRLYEKI